MGCPRGSQAPDAFFPSLPPSAGEKPEFGQQSIYMERRNAQRSSELVGAAPPAGRVRSMSAVRAMPEILFQPKDSERLGAEVWGGAVHQELGKLPMSETIARDLSQIPQWISRSVPPTRHVPNTDILPTLQQLHAKMDHLQNTMQDIPLKVAEVMEQIWRTKGQEFLKNRVTSVEMVSPAMDRDYDRHAFPPAGEPSICLQQAFNWPFQPKQCLKPVITDEQSQKKQCMQPGITDGQSQQNQCIQPSVADWRCQQESHAIQPRFSGGHNQEENLCTQPVLTDGQNEQHNQCIEPLFANFDCHQPSQAVKPTQAAFTDGQNTVQRLKLEPLSPEEKWQEEKQALQQTFQYEQGSDHIYELDPWCSNEQGPAEPSKSLGSETLPADEPTLIDSLARRNGNLGMPLLKATPENADITEAESLNMNLGSLAIQGRKSIPSADGQVPSDTDSHKCTYCEKNFLQRSQLMIHLKMHRNEKVLACSVCDKCFITKSRLLNHKRCHMDGRLYKCTECDKSFTQHSQLCKHQQSHTDERPYQCSQCEKRFSRIGNLHTHQIIHSGKKPFECTECEYGAITETESLKMSLKRLAIQRKKRNPSGDGEVPSDKVVQKITDSEKTQMLCTCTECGESFKDRGSFLRHQSSHSRPHKCTDCEESFIQRSQLLTHLKTHRNENMFACSACDKCFTHRSSLAIHKRCHMDERLYKCTVCDKSFMQRSQLCKHQRSHTGERPYQCSQCEKRFSQIGNLHNHQMIHSGEKPFECTECGKRFNKMSNLKMHRRIHSGEKPYKCTECGKQFTQRSHLMTHQRLHVG